MEELKKRKPLKGTPCLRSICFECDEEIIKTNRKWIHTDLSHEHDHEARPTAHGE